MGVLSHNSDTNALTSHSLQKNHHSHLTEWSKSTRSCFPCPDPWPWPAPRSFQWRRSRTPDPRTCWTGTRERGRCHRQCRWRRAQSSSWRAHPGHGPWPSAGAGTFLHGPASPPPWWHLPEVRQCSTPVESKPGQCTYGHSWGAVWESRWPSCSVRPNEPSGFRRRQAILNRAHAHACP